jgi:hypothetical protein
MGHFKENQPPQHIAFQSRLDSRKKGGLSAKAVQCEPADGKYFIESDLPLNKKPDIINSIG